LLFLLAESPGDARPTDGRRRWNRLQSHNGCWT